MQGEGTCMSSNGYCSEFKDDSLNGQGTCKYANRNVYSGEWKDGSHHGQGTCNCANGDMYSGEWKDDCRHGQGTLTISGGNVYSGWWKDDCTGGQHIDGSRLSGVSIVQVFTSPRTAVCMVQAKTEDGKWKTVPMYEKGMDINYTNANGTQSGIVLTVHFNDLMEPYYTVLLQDGNEKQTDNVHITLRVEDKVSGRSSTKAISNQPPIALIDPQFVTASTTTVVLKVGKNIFFNDAYAIYFYCCNNRLLSDVSTYAYIAS
jgi:hypothetical protein